MDQGNGVRYLAEPHLKVGTGCDVCPEQGAQMASSATMRDEPECPKGAPLRRYQIIGFLRALTLASDGSGYGAPYELDLEIRDSIGGGFRGRAGTDAGPEAVTVRWSESSSTLSRIHSTSNSTMSIQLPHDKEILPCLHTTRSYVEAHLERSGKPVVVEASLHIWTEAFRENA